MSGRPSSNWFLLPVTTVVLVGLFCLSTLQTVEGVQCYVCSWSPADSNRVDVCTRKNFSESVRTHSCETGCETVTVFDKNGRLDFFYRNCAANTSSITGTCFNETSKAITKEICNCDSNYCNKGSGLEQQLGIVLSGILALLMMVKF
ncbi:hypothetical protein GHT06_017634 [Daphnia sinensis]|uniref:Protein sleepless n=1 Tax=Daphnia sinensis TaxID=1820382 RepID=A0AAD5PSC3_9CRUS|nr:hypothetical protein GHT06_017634 [Daphnia sinensis]